MLASPHFVKTLHNITFLGRSENVGKLEERVFNSFCEVWILESKAVCFSEC